MTNKENHKENIRLADGIFWHGRYFKDGQVQVNKDRKRDIFLAKRRRGIIFDKDLVVHAY